MKDRMFFIFMGLAALWTIVALAHIDGAESEHLVFLGSAITSGLCLVAATIVYRKDDA